MDFKLNNMFFWIESIKRLETILHQLIILMSHKLLCGLLLPRSLKRVACHTQYGVVIFNQAIEVAPITKARKGVK